MTWSKSFSDDELERLKSWLPPDVDGELEIETISAIGKKPNTTNNATKQRESGGNHLPTADEIEAIRQEAQQEGYQVGYDAGKEEGFKFAHEEAKEQQKDMFSKQSTQLNNLMEQLNEPFLQLDDQVENEVLVLVTTLVKQLIRREIQTDPSHIVGVVREALQVLPVSARDARLILHHDDAELIRQVYAMGDIEQKWEIIEDPVMQRGGCKVLTTDSQVDATLEARIAALVAPLLSDTRATLNKEDDDNV